jgi:hypothetical protein
MSDPFARMTPGMSLESGVGPFNLEWHNAVSDSVRHTMREKSAGLNQGDVQLPDDTKIWLANVEGEIIPQYTAIGINDLATFPDDFSDFRNRMCFVTAPLVRNRPFAIVQKTIHANQIFVAKSAIAADGDQPPSPGWARLIGNADPFDAPTHYAIGEQVTAGGETYAAIRPVDGQVTSDTAYWVPLGSRRGMWDGSAYAAGEVVSIPSLGEILISGISRLLLYVSHPRHMYAGVSELGISTQEEPGPLEIIWKEDGTGEKWAIVRFIHDAFDSQVCTGAGALAFGSLELSAAGIRYGGDLTAGVLTLAGSGTSSPPIYTGDGAGSLPGLTLSGSGSVYDPYPSGRLYFGVLALAGTGTVVNPPSGFGFAEFGSLTLAGTGTNTPPTCTGTGALVFGSLEVDGDGNGGPGITSINGQTGPAVTLASAGGTVAITTPSANVVNLEVPEWTYVFKSVSFNYTANPNEIIDVFIPENLSDTAFITTPAGGRIGEQIVIRLANWYTTGNRSSIRLFGVTLPSGGVGNFVDIDATFRIDGGGFGTAKPVLFLVRFDTSATGWHIASTQGLVFEPTLSSYVRTPSMVSASPSGLIFQNGFYTGGTLAITGGTW